MKSASLESYRVLNSLEVSECPVQFIFALKNNLLQIHQLRIMGIVIQNIWYKLSLKQTFSGPELSCFYVYLNLIECNDFAHFIPNRGS